VNKLSIVIKEQFKKKLQERLLHPKVLKDKLSGFENCYKIKLRSAGYRMVYQVIERELVVSVIAVAKRDKEYVYKISRNRI
jgi:mRNA interferase RelE/StbE